jgi:hypothetical protein
MIVSEPQIERNFQQIGQIGLLNDQRRPSADQRRWSACPTAAVEELGLRGTR